MAQLVLGVAGAAIGSMFGATAIGWEVGVLAGSLLFPTDSGNTQGPRISDLSVQSSTVGTAQPILYGAMRVNGNVIFCTSKREVSTTASESGKGGPTSSSTTYSYNVDIAIALCANPITGISKIWNNGALIYDMSTGADLASVVASSLNSAGFTVYYGSESQLPDPTIEATIGAGNVPGYRGVAYVLFSQLDCPNGSIPQLSFEVITVGSGAPYEPVIYCDFQAPAVTMGTSATTPTPVVVPGIDRMGNVWTLSGYAYYQLNSSVGNGIARLSGVGISTYVLSISFLQTPANAAFGIAGDFTIEMIISAEIGSYTASRRGCLAACSASSASPATGDWFLTQEGDITIGGVPSRSIQFSISGTASNLSNTGVVPITSADYKLTITRTGTTLNMYVNDVLVGQRPGVSVIPLSSTSPVVIGALSTTAESFATHLNCFGVFKRFALTAGAGVTSTEPTVASVITDICERAGLDSGQLDTSALSDTVHGYALTNISAARDNLTPLQQGFFIDAQESDGLLKWLPRASLTSVATIYYDELGANQDGSAPGDPLALQRGQEADMPRSMAINYINVDADYQQGTETARRIITSSVNDVVQQLPIACDNDRAASVADALLYDSWNERNQYTAQVTRKFAYLDAGDVVTVEYPQGTFTAKRITAVSDTGIYLTLTLVDSDAAIYTVQGTGASPAQAQVGVSLPSPSNMQIMDIPILRDADNNPGLYTALAGFAAGWPGAVLYMGPDDASLAPRGGVTQPTVLGAADSALGNWTSQIVDQTNTLLVTIGPGTLSSATRDAVMDTGANLAAIGAPGRWEIIAFITATLVAGTQYRLSGLLRGLYGTEAMAPTHVIGDAFVMLQFGGLLRPSFDLAELNQPRQFRAITTGQSINTASSITSADTGVGLKPFNPVNLRRSTASNDITLTWDRRTRSSVTFPANGVDVPLFESAESYSVDVYSSNTFATVVRTIASSTPTITYTGAQQTADGLTPGAVVNVRVYQIGAAGRGNYLQGTI